MESNIKVVKKHISGLVFAKLDENAFAMEIQEQESLGWTLISSFGASLSGFGKTEVIVFIYRKK
jgi:hypothetical protein